MLASDKHHIRAIAIKKRLREIEAIDDLTDEVRGESDGLQTELIDVETRQAAALASEGATVGVETGVEGLDAEARERIELRGRATLSGYLMAALAGRMPDGAEAEFAAAHHAPAGHVPIDLRAHVRHRRGRGADRPVEFRGVDALQRLQRLAGGRVAWVGSAHVIRLDPEGLLHLGLLPLALAVVTRAGEILRGFSSPGRSRQDVPGRLVTILDGDEPSILDLVDVNSHAGPPS